MDDIYRINGLDNVAVALSFLKAGTTVNVGEHSFVLVDDIPAGHKIALTDLKKGDIVIKYGFPIGVLNVDRRQGNLVNEKYLDTLLGEVKDYIYNPSFISFEKHADVPIFKGYERTSGDVGIRNELWVIPTVGCVNGVANELVCAFKKRYSDEERKKIDGIHAFTHVWGCSQLADDHENTRKILRNMILHPNAGGVLVLGLGCENNQMSSLKEMLGDFDESRIKFIECQKVDDEVSLGLSLLSDLYEIMKNDERKDLSVSKLRVGLKCGGSDGFSGITANPLLGMFSDRLVSLGGTCVLTEVPEMFGAETILMNRCCNEDTFNKAVALINNFKNYFIRNKQAIYENPSPGNKAGGISTLEEKSLGCTQKSGKSPIMDVLEYGDRICSTGLNLLSAPGNDLVASTALAASGCHIVLFTTGRGTPFGTFVPTVKISTNTSLYIRKTRWVDFNAGVLIEESKSSEILLEEFFTFVVDICSGTYAKNEINGYKEISIFKTGVIL